VIDLGRFYKLTDRDKTGQVLEIYNEGQQDTAGAETDLTVYHTIIPQDQILIVESWCVHLLADNTEPNQVVFGTSFNLSGTEYFAGLNSKLENFQGVAQVWQSNQLPMTILAGERPAVRGYFLVAGAHTIQSRIRGWLIPKANMARGFGGL